LRLPFQDHFRHHGRFYLSAACGLAVGSALVVLERKLSVSVGGATFFIVYLAASYWEASSLTAKDLRAKASLEDEGIVVIVLITIAAITISLGSLAMQLGVRQAGCRLVPAIANVPLGWATLHTVMAFHYAHLFYSASGDGKEKAEAGGLEFPKTKEPAISDFVYYSFVVGMTAQVSDVDTTSREMRNTTTAHGIVSFFYNTVILAFAVNALTR
jgi:uncharacterized membrane protein